MKKILSVLLALCIAGGVLSMAGCGSEDRVTLNVYNWGEYIDESVLADFEAQTGIRVNYTTYANNEEMYAKVSSGAASYDVVVPSDYMIAKMRGALYMGYNGADLQQDDGRSGRCGVAELGSAVEREVQRTDLDVR